MTEKILIDVGSSTIKAYCYKSKKLELLLQRSIGFKDSFDAYSGISVEAKKELFELIDSVKINNLNAPIKIYATGIFRKLTDQARSAFIDEFFLRTNLFFNIISHDLENFYLEMALVGKCSLNEPILLINIGGGSTELVVMYGNEAIERHNIDLGAGAINTAFPRMNQSLSEVPLEHVIEFVVHTLPPLSNKVVVAFYNGGELTYMQLAKYALKHNSLFNDADHSLMIQAQDFAAGNKHVFHGLTLEELESLMPHDPKWMHGARGCSAIAQAIGEKYGIETIIPSDSNTVHGIVRQELRYATLSGSFRKHLDYILGIKQQLESSGIRILSPRFTEPKNPGETFFVFTGEEGLSPLELERHHLKSIADSDALVVCDPNGYVGASALLEIGYAHALGKRIIFAEKPEEFMLNTLPAEIGL